MLPGKPTNLRGNMDNGKIIAAIDEQIGKLQQARQLLGGASSTGRRAGRKATSTGKRTLSAAARKKISLAQKARWSAVRAKQKKAA
jgi:hypothetical protein